jgi:hypothetical protein
MEGAEKFIEAVTPLLGREISIWTVRLDRPYARGLFLRCDPSGLVIAGHGTVAYADVDKVECDGITHRFADLWVA